MCGGKHVTKSEKQLVLKKLFLRSVLPSLDGTCTRIHFVRKLSLRNYKRYSNSYSPGSAHFLLLIYSFSAQIAGVQPVGTTLPFARGLKAVSPHSFFCWREKLVGISPRLVHTMTANKGTCSLHAVICCCSLMASTVLLCIVFITLLSSANSLCLLGVRINLLCNFPLLGPLLCNLNIGGGLLGYCRMFETK